MLIDMISEGFDNIPLTNIVKEPHMETLEFTDVPKRLICRLKWLHSRAATND